MNTVVIVNYRVENIISYENIFYIKLIKYGIKSLILRYGYIIGPRVATV